MDCICGEMEAGWGVSGHWTSDFRMLWGRHSSVTTLGSWSFPKARKGTPKPLLSERQPWGWGLLVSLNREQCSQTYPRAQPQLLRCPSHLYVQVSHRVGEGKCSVEVGNIMTWLSLLGVVVSDGSQTVSKVATASGEVLICQHGFGHSCWKEQVWCPCPLLDQTLAV